MSTRQMNHSTLELYDYCRTENFVIKRCKTHAVFVTKVCSICKESLHDICPHCDTFCIYHTKCENTGLGHFAKDIDNNETACLGCGMKENGSGSLTKKALLKNDIGIFINLNILLRSHL